MVPHYWLCRCIATIMTLSELIRVTNEVNGNCMHCKHDNDTRAKYGKHKSFRILYSTHAVRIHQFGSLLWVISWWGGSERAYRNRTSRADSYRWAAVSLAESKHVLLGCSSLQSQQCDRGPCVVTETRKVKVKAKIKGKRIWNWPKCG